MAFYKDDAGLKVARLTPERIYHPLPAAGTALGKLARTYNRIGGLADKLAATTGIEPVAVLAVWYVESGGNAFTPGSPIIRFENHKLFKYWGNANAARFDRHFQFGGRAGIPGTGSKNHKFRRAPTAAWASFHGDQRKEYEVFSFATSLASLEAAALSTSFGGPQIMGFNHGVCGYANATALFNAFRESERWHVLGFFDFCKSGGIIADIKAKRWVEIGRKYNGDGATYGPLLRAAYELKDQLAAVPKVPAPAGTEGVAELESPAALAPPRPYRPRLPARPRDDEA